VGPFLARLECPRLLSMTVEEWTQVASWIGVGVAILGVFVTAGVGLAVYVLSRRTVKVAQETHELTDEMRSLAESGLRVNHEAVLWDRARNAHSATQVVKEIRAEAGWAHSLAKETVDEGGYEDWFAANSPSRTGRLGEASLTASKLIRDLAVGTDESSYCAATDVVASMAKVCKEHETLPESPTSASASILAPMRTDYDSTPGLAESVDDLETAVSALEVEVEALEAIATHAISEVRSLRSES